MLKPKTSQNIDLDPQKSYELIQENKNNSDFVVLDVRTPAEYEESHIE